MNDQAGTRTAPDDARSACVDRPRAVRDEDRFDIEALDAWLKARVPGLRGTPEVMQFAKGASNLTYLLVYPDQEFVLRRPPAGTKARSAHDVLREFRIQQALAPVFPKVPKMLAACDDPSVIGSEFYVMERVPGIILRSDPPDGLDLDREQVRSLCRAAIDTLIELHSVDIEAAGLDRLAKGAGYNRRQIEGWSERFRRAKTWNVMSGERVMHWLAERIPDEVSICLVHGDYRFDNLVLDAKDPLVIRAVLDWEMATLGDPLMDLGNALAYWVQADDDRFFRSFRRQPTHLPGMYTRREVVEYYCERTGIECRDWAFYEVYGLFRLAVIAQQIYYRYHHGQTRNPAFRRFWIAVNYLLWRCGRVIARAG